MANDFMLAYREELNQATLRPQPPAQDAESKLELVKPPLLLSSHFPDAARFSL